MVTGSAARSRAVSGAVGATLLAGVLTYVLLAIVSRSLTDAAFDRFSVFWALSLLVGFGAFAAVEQEIARASAAGADARTATRAPLRTVAVLAVVATAVAAGVGIATIGGGSTVMLVALAALGPVSAVQFLARGFMLGARRLRPYAIVLAGDAVLRVALAAAVAAVLAGSVGLADPDAAGWFALALCAAILLAHAWVLAGLRGAPRPAAIERRAASRAVVALLGAGVVSQLLLNAGPLLIEAADAGVGAAGAFQATFNVARIPLFVLVPLQGLLLAPFVRLFDHGERSGARRMLVRLVAAAVLVSLVGAVVAWAIGPWVVELVFGEGRALAGGLTAVLVAGACLNAGLVILTQALIALRRHRFASVAWLVALAAAVIGGVSAAGATGDMVAAVSIAFALGSAAGLATAAVELTRAASRPEEVV